MVALDKIEMIMSTIAVLIEAPTRPPRVDQQHLQTLIRGPLSINQTIAGELAISSQRDQIEAVAGGNRINVKDMSGRTNLTESKVPSVLLCLIDGFGTPVSAYGINFQLSVPQTEPAKWIQDHVLSTEISQKAGRPVKGGSVTLVLESGTKTWSVTLKADKKGILIDFNAHQAGQLPDQGMLLQEMQEQFNALLGFLNSVGL